MSNVLEYIEITNNGLGTFDGKKDMVIIEDYNPQTPVIRPPYIAENVANKKNNLQNPNITGYTSTLAVYNAIIPLLSASTFNYFTGTTLPTNYYNKTQVDSLFSGVTGNTGKIYNFIESGATKIKSITGTSFNTIIIYSPSGGTSNWNDINNKPSWLSGTTLNDFENNHSHSQYNLVSNFNTFTGETLSKIDYISGVTVNNYNSFTGHTSNLAIHYPMSSISINENQVTNLPTDLSYLQTQINNLAAIQSSDRIYIFQHEFSDVLGYEQLSPTVLSLTGATETVTVNGTQLVDTYITPSEGLGVTGITSGVWIIHFHAQTNIGDSSNMRFDFYKRVGNIETLLFQSGLKPITTTGVTEYQIEETHDAFTGLSLTDRLVVKVYVVTTANRTVTWTYGQSTNNAYISVPIKLNQSPIWSSIQGKPSWLSGNTLSDFENAHNHNQYYLINDFNSFTGTTLPNNYYDKSQINSYSGKTNNKIVYISGVTDNKLNTITFTTFTGTTLPANYYNKAIINGWTGGTGVYEFISYTASDITTDLAINNNAASFPVPFNCTLLGVFGALDTVCSGSTFIADIYYSGVTAFGVNKINIESGEYSSLTATNQPTLSVINWLKGVKLNTRITQVGITTKGKGLTIHLMMRRT
jgi:hypothetical protein